MAEDAAARRREAMRRRLPSVWRPDPAPEGEEPDRAAGGFAAPFLRTVAALLGRVDQDVGEVLRSRWWSSADRGDLSPYRRLRRAAAGDPPPPAGKPKERDHPYVRDLARLGALLAVPPWREPPGQRETVEDYRLRLKRMVKLHRRGTGTLEAVRRAVEAALPRRGGAGEGEGEVPVHRRDRPFDLEEEAPLDLSTREAPTRGPPDGLLGPLMRWSARNDGFRPAPPVLEVEAGEDGAVRPLVECWAGGGDVPVGIGYRGELGPGEVLRLRPFQRVWAAVPDGLLRAEARPSGTAAPDPGRPRGWTAAPEEPGGEVTDFARTPDGFLWAAVAREEGGELWRRDAEGWSRTLDALPTIRCLRADGFDLLVGTDGGARRVRGLAAGGPAVAEVAGLEGRTVHDLLPEGGGLWAATDAGLLEPGDGGLAPAGPWAEGEEAAAALALHRDGTGILHVGTARGVVQHHPGSGRWYRLQAGTRGDEARDWVPYPSSAPEGADRTTADIERPWLPAVRALRRGPDAALWLGTDRGLARYRTLDRGGAALTTRLEAFPDLDAGPVHAVEADGAGGLWFATGGGLLRWDGREFWLEAPGERVRLGRAETLDGGPATRADVDVGPILRGAWRYAAAGEGAGAGGWERWSAASDAWQPEDVWVDRTGERPVARSGTVRAVAWSDHVAGRIGRREDGAFRPEEEVDPEELVLRCKPEPDRPVDGGVPFVPALPAGESTWRYLSLEGPDDEEPDERPAWTREGRLLPDSDAPAEGIPGRFDAPGPPPAAYDRSVFAYEPVARVRMAWRPRRPLRFRVKLHREARSLDPAVLDRVWEAIRRVRPAGSRSALTVEGEVTRGDDHESG